MQLLRSTIMTLLFAMATHAATECSQLLGLNAKYYQFPTFGYAPNVTAGQTPPYAPYLSRVESVIDYEFGSGGIGTVPGGTKHNDYVMVTWEGFYAAPANGTYRFNCISDDGCRILLDNQLILNNWAPQQSSGVMSDYVSLDHYTLYPLRVEYFNRFGGCAVHLQYSSDDLGIPLTLVPATELYSSQCNIAPFDNCQSNPCLNGATCIDGNGDFTCTCPNGFSGKRCQNVVTPTCQPFTAPKPSGSNTGTAIINSTPLIQSYMNDAFDVRDIGPFYAAYSLDGQTVLQINIAMYNTSATSPTVANSVALYYKGATVVLDTKGKTTVSNLSGKVTQSVQGSTQTFTTTNGFVLVATRVGTFYSIHATASASYSNFVRGLIGTLSGNANSDMTDMNGNIVTFPEFVSAWKVPVTQDLSLNPMATFSPLYRDTSINCNPGTNSNPTPTPTGTGTCDTNSLGRIVSVHQEGVETIMCFAYRNTEKTICSGGSYMPSNTCGDSCST